MIIPKSLIRYNTSDYSAWSERQAAWRIVVDTSCS